MDDERHPPIGPASVLPEKTPLYRYGNRLPQLCCEAFGAQANPTRPKGLIKAVTMMPASREFTHATEAVRKTVGASTTVFGRTTGARRRPRT